MDYFYVGLVGFMAVIVIYSIFTIFSNKVIIFSDVIQEAILGGCILALIAATLDKF